MTDQELLEKSAKAARNAGLNVRQDELLHALVIDEGCEWTALWQPLVFGAQGIKLMSLLQINLTHIQGDETTPSCVQAKAKGCAFAAVEAFTDESWREPSMLRAIVRAAAHLADAQDAG